MARTPDAQNAAAILYALQGLRNLEARGFYHGPTQGLVDPTAVYRQASAQAANRGAFQHLPAQYGGGLPATPAAVPVAAEPVDLASLLRGLVGSQGAVRPSVAS